MAEVIRYQDAAGDWFKEVIDSSYIFLTEMRYAEQQKGRLTWLNLFEHADRTTPAKWMLTIKTGKEQL